MCLPQRVPSLAHRSYIEIVRKNCAANLLADPYEIVGSDLAILKICRIGMSVKVCEVEYSHMAKHCSDEGPDSGPCWRLTDGLRM